MKLLAAFFKLIRWPNLFFIALTQTLFYYGVFRSLTPEPGLFPDKLFLLLMLASILIAAAGYIINDYFDMQIDAINKPSKRIIDKVIKRRWAILWHWILSLAGIFISFYISRATGNWMIVLVNTLCVVLLWFYSTHFKKMLLIGNIIISALTAWVIVVVYFFAGADLVDIHGWQQYPFDVRKFFKYTMLYAGFAFIISLIREVVKDLEDMHGDALYNCKTMPVVWGVKGAKIFAGVWLAVAIAALTIVQLYAWQLGWWYGSVYCILFIILPLCLILKNLYKAKYKQEYQRLSTHIKMVMFAGILSMVFFTLPL